MEKKRFEIGSPLYKDENKISKTTRDLEAFSKILQTEITKNIESGFLCLNDLSTELVEGLAMFQTERLSEIIQKKYIDESNKIKLKPARDKFLEECNEAIKNVAEQYEAVKEDIKKNWLSSGFYINEPHQRLKFLEVCVYEKNFTITYNSSKIEDYYTCKVETETQADILNRAYELFEVIVQTDKEISDLTGGRVSIIAGNGNGLINYHLDTFQFVPKALAGYKF